MPNPHVPADGRAMSKVVPFPIFERLPTMEECIRDARAFRQRVVDEIQYLIDFLDDLDDDPDFESYLADAEPNAEDREADDSDDEPYLSGFGGMGDDREGAHHG